MIPFTSAWFRARAAKKAAAKAEADRVLSYPRSTPRYYSGTPSPSPAPAPSESFGTSYLVASATDSMPLGYMAGGSLTGALLGASSHSHAAPEPAPAPSYSYTPAPAPSYDWGSSSSSCDSSSSSSSSYDSGSSSCDSSSSSSWD